MKKKNYKFEYEFNSRRLNFALILYGMRGKKANGLKRGVGVDRGEEKRIHPFSIQCRIGFVSKEITSSFKCVIGTLFDLEKIIYRLFGLKFPLSLSDLPI